MQRKLATLYQHHSFLGKTTAAIQSLGQSHTSTTFESGSDKNHSLKTNLRLPSSIKHVQSLSRILHKKHIFHTVLTLICQNFTQRWAIHRGFSGILRLPRSLICGDGVQPILRSDFVIRSLFKVQSF